MNQKQLLDKKPGKDVRARLSPEANDKLNALIGKQIASNGGKKVNKEVFFSEWAEKKLLDEPM